MLQNSRPQVHCATPGWQLSQQTHGSHLSVPQPTQQRTHGCSAECQSLSPSMEQRIGSSVPWGTSERRGWAVVYLQGPGTATWSLLLLSLLCCAIETSRSSFSCHIPAVPKGLTLPQDLGHDKAPTPWTTASPSFSTAETHHPTPPWKNSSQPCSFAVLCWSHPGHTGLCSSCAHA